MNLANKEMEERNEIMVLGRRVRQTARIDFTVKQVEADMNRCRDELGSIPPGKDRRILSFE